MNKEGFLSWLSLSEKDKDHSLRLNTEITTYLRQNFTMDMYPATMPLFLSYTTTSPLTSRYPQGFQLAYDEKAPVIDQTYLAVHAASHIIRGDLLEHEGIIEYPLSSRKAAFVYDLDLLQKHTDALYLTESLLKAENEHTWGSAYTQLTQEMGHRWAERATGHPREIHTILTKPEYLSSKAELLKRTEKERKVLHLI